MSSKSLVIVESPAKANTIRKFLGKNYDVLASVGHVMDLPKNDLGVDIDNGFNPTYIVPKGKQKILTKLKKAAKDASEVYLALDMDREGEAIAWHIQRNVEKVQKNIRRIIFNEITKNAILQAISSPTVVDMNKVEAQQARRILDRLVGYQISPILWQIFYYGLSAGRVQTVGLRLICERQEEIEAFNPKEYWTIEAAFRTMKGQTFPAKLVQFKGKKIELKSKDQVDPIIEKLNKSSFRVSSLIQKEKRRNPYPPYITSTLQRDAARRLKFSAKKIMVIAQQLYEGVNLGRKERVGLITYMRTDSTRLSGQAKENAAQFIESNFGKEYLPGKPKSYRQRKDIQDAHEAIRPTSVDRTPEVLRKYLTKDQFAIYELIWRRFLASQMASASFDTTEVSIKANDYTFKALGRVMTFTGFLKVYKESSNSEETALPKLSEGEDLKADSIDGLQHFTEPPPSYTEATLIKELEELGIGRPSTYANIVSIIQEREYVIKQKSKLCPTTLGRQVWLTLKSSFPEVFDTFFTAQMELELDKIESGKDSWSRVVMDFYKPFSEALNKIDDKKRSIKQSLQEETDLECEKCGKKLIKKWGKNGQFLACPAYPKCRYSRPLEEDSVSQTLEASCPKCGASLVVKVGRYGKFAACNRYPECKHTEPLTIGMDCPNNGCGGQVVEKITRRGKTFYGCSNYPKCNFASWNRPVPNICQNCANPYLVEKISKKKGTFLFCPQCKEEFGID